VRIQLRGAVHTIDYSPFLNAKLKYATLQFFLPYLSWSKSEKFHSRSSPRVTQNSGPPILEENDSSRSLQILKASGTRYLKRVRLAKCKWRRFCTSKPSQVKIRPTSCGMCFDNRCSFNNYVRMGCTSAFRFWGNSIHLFPAGILPFVIFLIRFTDQNPHPAQISGIFLSSDRPYPEKMVAKTKSMAKSLRTR
jgi:hypothetical protein